MHARVYVCAFICSAQFAAALEVAARAAAMSRAAASAALTAYGNWKKIIRNCSVVASLAAAAAYEAAVVANEAVAALAAKAALSNAASATAAATGTLATGAAWAAAAAAVMAVAQSHQRRRELRGSPVDFDVNGRGARLAPARQQACGSAWRRRSAVHAVAVTSDCCLHVRSHILCDHTHCATTYIVRPHALLSPESHPVCYLPVCLVTYAFTYINTSPHAHHIAVRRPRIF